MKWTRVRGLTCLSVVLFVASSALAQELDFAAARENFQVGDNSPQPRGMLSNAGIDRLLDINSTHDSLFSTNRADEDATDQAIEMASAPLGTVEDAPLPQNRGIYMIAGIGGALALGLGLCCASMMSGRQRTINTFTAGFVRVK